MRNREGDIPGQTHRQYRQRKDLALRLRKSSRKAVYVILVYVKEVKRRWPMFQRRRIMEMEMEQNTGTVGQMNTSPLSSFVGAQRQEKSGTREDGERDCALSASMGAVLR